MAIITQQNIDTEINQDDAIASTQFQQRWERIGDAVRSYIAVTFDQLHAASRTETEALLEGLDHAPTNERDLMEWERFTTGKMKEMQRSAHALYYDEFMDPLIKLLSDKVISQRTIRELDDAFRDTNVEYKDREKYIRGKIPLYMQKWIEVKIRWNTLRKDPRVKQLTTDDIENLPDFLQEDRFIELKYPTRKGLVDTVEAAINAKESGLEALYADTKKELKGYVADGCLHSTKVGTWLLRIFTDHATPEHIDAFMNDTVRPYRDAWIDVRAEFNELNAALPTNAPEGFRPISLDAFLLKPYPERTAYCSLGWLSIKEDDARRKTLASLKLKIRYELDTEYWDGAKALIAEAKQMAPQDRELQQMEQSLPKKDDAEKTEVEPMKTLHLLRSMVAAMPEAMQKYYIQALQSNNPDILRRLHQLIYNVEYAVENGYTDEHRMQEEASSDENKLKTKKRIPDGHENAVEHNIVDGDTAIDGAIADDPTKAQYIYPGSHGNSVVFGKIVKNAENEKFGYWSILVLNVPYETIRNTIKNVHRPMRSALANLHRQGLMFTLTGSPQSLN